MFVTDRQSAAHWVEQEHNRWRWRRSLDIFIWLWFTDSTHKVCNRKCTHPQQMTIRHMLKRVSRSLTTCVISLIFTSASFKRWHRFLLEPTVISNVIAQILEHYILRKAINAADVHIFCFHYVSSTDYRIWICNNKIVWSPVQNSIMHHNILDLTFKLIAKNLLCVYYLIIIQRRENPSVLPAS